MTQGLTSIATFTEAIARTLEKYQIDSAELFVSLGLEPKPFRDPDARIPQETMMQIWESLHTLTGNPCIGFEVGMDLRSSNLHAVGFAWLASATVREALERLVRYQKLITSGANMQLLGSGEMLEFHQNDAPLTSQYGVDAAFCAIVQLCRDVSRSEFAPLAVRMRCKEPPCAPQLRKFFGTRVHYGSNDNVLVFSTASVDELLDRGNPALAHAGDNVARTYMAEMDRNDILAKARALLVAHMPDGEPSRKILASEMHMSERTLSRKLEARRYTFSALLDEIRSHTAKDYLRQSRYSITEIAFLLGFSDQSNFARAFKRWSGLSPSEFRQSSQVSTDGASVH